ncbi:major facilitator superfamily-domain-containing protein [Aspergillus ambiguus]|uniref:MFS transporter n=1 Tax=Aspergillus ambiguus TaxID=176160 RepID=UPI003CCDB511
MKNLGEDLDLGLQQQQSHVSIAQTFSPVREIVFVFVICMAQFMTQAGLGQCLSPLTIIGDSLGIQNDGILSWCIAGYSLTVGTFILFFGRCGDVFGYRPMFIIGFAWFALWSLVCGLSVYSNYVLFIFARTLQGLGPAMLLPNGLAILGATYQPGTKKNIIFALFAASAPNGAVIGGVFGALLAQLAWWPWLFWIMAIVCALCAFLGWLVVPPIQHEREKDSMTCLEWLQELDIMGAILGVGGLVLINIAWNQAPSAGWEMPYVYVILIIGAIVLALFFFWELHFAVKPLIPFHALTLDVSFVLGCVACGWAAFGIWSYYTWLFFERIRGITPLLASAEYVPPTVSGLLASVTTGYLMSWLRPSWIMLMSMVAFTVGIAVAGTAPVGQTYWAQTFVSMIVMPWGMDMSFPASTVLLSNAVERKHQGIAASLVTTVVNYSISLGLGFAGTVEVYVNNGGHTFHDVLAGYRGSYYIGIGLGGLGIAVSLVYLIKSILKDRKIEEKKDSYA